MCCTEIVQAKIVCVVETKVGITDRKYYHGIVS